ncbi:AB-hydrolase YheT [Coemansia reversa NRRL 1564]|uniref:AB-hydrolase YheT n=1 Tax=Coemansia reversa (strain ATCC 12441 / NRRL 1564) TaxID=763665 RepID=A0A2G5B2W3_COERN|nr:AB-hydrolase YheT [Coemansia reversa NRRL 1564]|eukprot:PIA13362.1 AB-hydrolase YheT [Coemansia reversa NRRL 1564]
MDGYNKTLAYGAAAGVTLYYGASKYVENSKVKLVLDDNANRKDEILVHSLIEKHCPSLSNSAKAYLLPSPFLCTGTLQTIYCSGIALKRDKLSNIKYERELREMSDGGTVSIDWYPGRSNSDAESTQPIAIVIPGLGGSSYEYHIRSLAKHLAENSQSKFSVAAINHRGSGRTPLTSSKLYNAYDTSDLHEIVQYISESFPRARLVCIGFSMGANILTRYMGEEGDHSKLSAAIVISCPFDMLIAGRALSTPGFLNDRLFQPSLMATLRRVLERNIDMIKTSKVGYNIDAVLKAKRVSDVDDHITAKAYGFSNCWEYYKAASSSTSVDEIRRPFLAISAADDPITPIEGVPVDKFKHNPNTALVIVKHGGHIGFFSGISPRIWFMQPVAEFFDAVLVGNV